MNILSSTLTMTATNASPTNYNKSDLSTNPSPTTGATTYTAYYPTWSLTAGSAGSTITVKLTNASANVSGYGTVSCALTATLATISIVAPTQSGGTGGSTPTSGTGTSNSSAGTTKTSAGSTTSSPPVSGGSNTSQPQSTQTASDQSTTSDTTQTASNTNQAAVLSVSIVVKDGKNNPLKGAKVTLENQQAVSTTSDGTVIFKDTSAGNHKLSVTYGKQKIDRTITVSQDGKNNTVSVVIPIKKLPIFAYILAVLGIGATFTAALIFMRIRHKSGSSAVQSSEMPLSTTEQNQMYSLAFAETASGAIPDSIPAQNTTDQYTGSPQPYNAQELSNPQTPIDPAPAYQQQIPDTPVMSPLPEAPGQPPGVVQQPAFVQMPVAATTQPAIIPAASPAIPTPQYEVPTANQSPELIATQQTLPNSPEVATASLTSTQQPQDPYQVSPAAQITQGLAPTGNQNPASTQPAATPSIQNFPSHNTPDHTSV